MMNLTMTALMHDNGPAPKLLMKSVSHDCGYTWSSVTDREIPITGTVVDVVVLKSGNMALVMNVLKEGRHKLSVWLSTEEGRTRQYRKILSTESLKVQPEGIIRLSCKVGTD